MKAQLTAKYLQFLTKKNKNQNTGFTLIELLVVIIIIGILSAIALPSFLNQAAKARASEARTNVGAMNRAQQAYYLENQEFAVAEDSVPAGLGMGIEASDNYGYKAEAEDAESAVANYATSKKADLKSTVGGVFKDGGTTKTILCEEAEATEETDDDPTAPESADPDTGCGDNVNLGNK